MAQILFDVGVRIGRFPLSQANHAPDLPLTLTFEVAGRGKQQGADIFDC
jgi:hypothetical protein